MKQNINKALLNHFSFGEGVASYLRGIVPNLIEDMNEFFSTRSDIQRIKNGEVIAEKILSLTDFGDVIELRREVAKLEINRLIKYNRQTDHTAHTVYLFLLGILIYDNIPILRNRLVEYLDTAVTAKLFIFQWIFASLLHDIGYIFYRYEDGENDDSWNMYDKLFDASYIPNYITGSRDIEKGKYELKLICKEFVKKHKEALMHKNLKDTNELLEQLNNIPWIYDLFEDEKNGLEILLSSVDIEKELLKFAKNTATNGYGEGGKPEVDHAIASGLMLLKYTSVWYWIYEKARSDYAGLYKELNKYFNYPIGFFIKHVIPACKAVVYHNISDMKINYTSEPLLYLEILCDELQMWDRFWSGAVLVDNWEELEHCMAENIYVDFITDVYGERQIHFYLPREQYEKLYKTLDKRLCNWNNFIKLSVSVD